MMTVFKKTMRKLIFLILIAPWIIAAQLVDNIVVIINDEVIVRSALEQQIRLIEQDLRRQKIKHPAPQELEKQVLDNMIVTRLQLQLAKSTGIEVEENTLNEALQNIAQQNHLDLPTFRRTIEQDGYRYQKYREDLRNQMIIKRLQQREVVNKIVVTPVEIDNFLENQKQSNFSEYHLLHILIATPEVASPEAIAAQQAKAQEVFEKLRKGADFREMAVAVSNAPKALAGGDLGWFKLGEMPSLFQDLVKQMAIGDISEPIRNASGFHIIQLVDKRDGQKTLVTQTRVRHILIKTSELVSDFEAQSRLENLKTRIEAGEDFAQLARTNSEDTTTAAEGGALEWLSPGEMVLEFEEVMNRLVINQLSKPFKSRYGWHLVQVLERREHDNTEQTLRIKAAQQIQQRKIEEELLSWLRQLRDEAYIEYP